MTQQDIQSFIHGEWIGSGAGARSIANAVTGQIFAQAGNSDLDFEGMLSYARDVGGPGLRALTFHDRAKLLKALAIHLNEQKQALYDISFATGATQNDHAFDIDGGIGTVFVYASKGRREMPDAHVLLDGDIEQLSRDGSFLGQHIYTPLRGAAVHINAFNFPVWGMLEKVAPSILAGVPSIVKPATVSCYVTELAVRLIDESGLLPDGALQLVTGGLGNTLDLLTCQDAVTFTGSAATAAKLRSVPNLSENSVRFTAEQDSLNALSDRLSKVKIGDPQIEGVGMGALVSNAQKHDVLEKAKMIGQEAEQVYADASFSPSGDGLEEGAFIAPMVFHCSDPDRATHVHETEAFGPVSTIMGYRDLDHAVDLANRGQGSLVASVITRDTKVARDITMGSACFHGRLYFNNRDSMKESTGHGAPMPHMVHGGPGRAGGGEELGGIRGVKHFMQRTAVQGSPDILSAIGGKWVPGAATTEPTTHPFTRKFNELKIGDTLRTDPRKISLDDIEHFAEFTGDTFYAHMDQAAAERNPFFPGRVAHGYLLLSFAAGLFVEPNEGPVLANTGLDSLKFMKPVEPGDSISVELTVKHKTPRNEQYGEVRWHVRLNNQDNDQVAEYELLTMVSH